MFFYIGFCEKHLSLSHIPWIYVLQDLNDNLVGEFLYGIEIDYAALLRSVIQVSVDLFLWHGTQGLERQLQCTGQHHQADGVEEEAHGHGVEVVVFDLYLMDDIRDGGEDSSCIVG